MGVTETLRAVALPGLAEGRDKRGSISLPVPAQWITRPRLILTGLLAEAGAIVLLEGPSITLGAALWVLSLGLVAGACWGGRAMGAIQDAVVSRGEAVALGALLVAGLTLRLWAPQAFPNGIHGDEAALGLIAVDVLEGRGPHPFGVAFIRDPAPFMYAEAAFMAILGVGIGAPRAMAGAAGALTLVALWLLARPLFGVRVALVAAGLLAVSAAHLHFSRLAINVVEIPLFGLLALGLTWRGIREGRPFWHLLAGMALGFAQYAAFGSRVYAFILAGTYLLLALAHPRSWRAVAGGALLALLGTAVVLAPLLVHLRREPQLLWGHLETRSVFRRWDQATEIHGTADWLGVMLGQARINLLAFVNVPDRGPFYGFAAEPLLNAPIAVLFLLGLLLALARLRDPRFASLLLACAGVLAGGILSAGAPQFHRLLPMLPIACLLAALAADRLVSWVEERWASDDVRRTALLQGASSVLLGALVAWTALDGLAALFVRHPAAHAWQPQTAWARWAAEQGPGRTVLLAGAPDVYAWDERVRFLARGAPPRDALNPSADLPAILADDQPFVFALSPRLDDWLPLIQHLLPDARMESVPGPRGEPLLLAFHVPPGPRPTTGAAGLRGEVTVEERDQTMVLRRQDATLAFREARALGDGRPYHARWIGDLVIQTAGEYRLELFTDGAVELLLDGHTAIDAQTSPDPRSVRSDLHLTPGPHSLEVGYAYVRGPGILELRWRPPGGRRAVIPPSALRPG